MAKARKTSARQSSAKTTALNKSASSRVTKRTPTTKRTSTKQKTKPRQKPSGVRLTPAQNNSAPDFIVRGSNNDALFTLTAYRGEGMCLLAMNWKHDKPSREFVGFAIEYKEPEGTQFYPLLNRITFPGSTGQSGANAKASRFSPFQKFRWVHFPSQASLLGIFTYRVHPVFMDHSDVLSYGDYQEVGIELEAETYPGEMNICFTRGFISSQAFVRQFGTNGDVSTLLPANADDGLDFKPTHQDADKALKWMGFEARSVILGALDAAVGDTSAQVRIAAYDLNDPEIVSRLEKLGSRLKVIIDDSKEHKDQDSAESKAAKILSDSAGPDNVQRQHMGGLQHNKTLVVDGDKAKIAIGGSTNFSWRGMYVQNNNAVVVLGEGPVKIFSDAFENLWENKNHATTFDDTPSASWNNLGFRNINAQVTFSPHSKTNSALVGIGNDIKSTKSSLFYSLAFLSQTPGVVRDSIENVVVRDGIFVYGLADRSVGGLDLQLPNGNPPVAFPGNLLEDAPPPFNEEASGLAKGGIGTRMHHKFVVIDFNTPDARVYTGSYNFSVAADSKNGENLFLIRDRRVATSYMIEALAMFDHYEFRNLAAKSDEEGRRVELRKPPAEGSGEEAWWEKYWADPQKQHDRELFGN